MGASLFTSKLTDCCVWVVVVDMVTGVLIGMWRMLIRLVELFVEMGR
jgi:hypothetical protein